MDISSIKPVWEFLASIGIQVGTGAVIFIYGLHREWWIMGSQHRELRATCDKFAELAEVNGKVADTGLTIAKR